MSDSLYAIKIDGVGSIADPYRIAAAFEVDDDEIEAEDDFSKSEYVVSFEGALNTPEFKIIIKESYFNGVEVKVYRQIFSGANPSSVPVPGGQQLPLFYRAEEQFLISNRATVDDQFYLPETSDSVYALRIVGSGVKDNPYQVVSAFEVDDDEIEAEDDFSKAEYDVSFEGVLDTPEFKIIVKELYSNGEEIKVYRQIYSGNAPSLISLAGDQLPLFYKAEEKFVSSGVVPADDKYEGSRGLEDNFRGSSRSEFFDCRGVKGKGAGAYWEVASGGLGDDDYIIGKSSKSSYYDDASKNRETFLSVDDFQEGDSFGFLRSAGSFSGYKLVTVADSKYQLRLERLGASQFARMDAVLVSRKDPGDILACIDFDGPAPVGGWTAAAVF